MPDTTEHPAPRTGMTSDRRAVTPSVVNVQHLLAGQNEVRLIHREQEYRLRVTRQGKLILTK